MFNSDRRRVTIQEYLTLANGIRSGDPVDSIKGNKQQSSKEQNRRGQEAASEEEERQHETIEEEE